MAKKSTRKKAAARSKTAAKTASKSKARAKTTKKAAPSKKAASTPKKAAKKTAKKSTARGTTAAKKKTAAKVTARKKTSSAKAAGKKVASKKASPTKKATPSKAVARKKTARAATAAPPAAKNSGDAKKKGRKGITIVTPKPTKKARPKATAKSVPALTGSILGMGIGSGKPLIPSGPSAPAVVAPQSTDADGKKPKSPFTKRQLDKYKEVLLAKRASLLGDIDSMENEALKSQSGSLSHLPQHMAEQGSETYEQSLSLDLAAADRQLLREIDAALDRIRDRVYGVCERTGKPISKERLAELPWARYSIEAAREMERRVR